MTTSHNTLPAVRYLSRCLAGFLAGLFGLLWLTSAHAATNTWSGGGENDQWSTGANWTEGTPPVNGVDVLFTPADGLTGFYPGAVAPNNIVDADWTLNSVWSHPTGFWHVTEIPLGRTLTITGALQMTNLTSLGTNDYALWVGMQHNDAVHHTFTGQGHLVVNNPNAVVTVRSVFSSSSNQRATLDMSGLDTFTANVWGISVGGDGTVVATVNNFPHGILYLAKTNLVTSPSTTLLRPGRPPGNLSGLVLTIGDCIVSTMPQMSYVYLGDTNVFLGKSGIAVGWRRGNGTLQFNSYGGVAFFRDLAGTGRQDYWGIGDNNTGSTGFSSTGVADFTSGTVDAMVDIMYLGRGQTGSSGSGNGTLKISNGLIDVNTLHVGFQRANNGGAGRGVIETQGGPSVTNLIVNGDLRLGPTTGGTPARLSGSMVTINSAVIVKGSIMGGDASTNTLTLNDGSLWVGGHLGNVGGANDKPIGNLNLNYGTLTLNLGSAGNPITPVCNVSNLYVGSVVVNVEGSGLSPGVIPLIRYYESGSFAGIVEGSLPPLVSGSFSNSADTLYLVITGVDTPKWRGNMSGDWDINTTQNWITGVGGLPTTYQEAAIPGDPVLFDDTATGTTTVNLTTTLSPVSVTVNNTAKTYTFQGEGRLSGSASLSKQGSGMLVLANTGVNDFTGNVTVGGGTLRLETADNRLPINGVVTLADETGTVLDLNSFNQQLTALAGGGSEGGAVNLGAATLTVTGNGSEFAGIINGSGGLIKLGSGNQILAGANTYSGGTVISNGTLTVANASGSAIGNGDFLIAGGTLQFGNGGAAGNISQSTITNYGNVRFNRSDDFLFNKTITGNGSVTKAANNVVSLAPGNTYTGTTSIENGALRIGDASAVGTGLIVISGNGDARLELTNDVSVAQTIRLSSKGGALNGPPHLRSVGGTNILAGIIEGTSGGTDWSFQSDDGLLIMNGTFTNIQASASSSQVNLRGEGEGVWHTPIANGALPTAVTRLIKRDAGTWTLTSTSINTYSDTTVLAANGGKLVVDGAILNSSGVTVNSGATLAGSGFIACPVTNAAGSFLSPGSSIGTLTISNQLGLASTATSVFEVGNNTCDQVRGLTKVTFGGTLQIVVVGPIYGAEVFKLFDAQNYEGTFAWVDLPVLPAPFGWDPSALETQGILRVTGGIAIGSPAIVGGNMVVSGNGPADAAYRVFATTNIALPFNQWTQVGSGTFASGDGAFTFTDTNTASFTQRYYRVVTP